MVRYGVRRVWLIGPLHPASKNDGFTGDAPDRSIFALFLIAAATGILSPVILWTASIAEGIIVAGLSDYLGNFG